MTEAGVIIELQSYIVIGHQASVIRLLFQNSFNNRMSKIICSSSSFRIPLAFSRSCFGGFVYGLPMLPTPANLVNPHESIPRLQIPRSPLTWPYDIMTLLFMSIQKLSFGLAQAFAFSNA
jgi:hypothetical protein